MENSLEKRSVSAAAAIGARQQGAARLGKRVARTAVVGKGRLDRDVSFGAVTENEVDR
jgi:hypothetical protein